MKNAAGKRNAVADELSMQNGACRTVEEVVGDMGMYEFSQD